MPKRKNRPDARARILKTAAKVFAQKGFSGARVDEIAKAAAVPKSLIYYHFNSKDAILEQLVVDCLEKYNDVLQKEVAGYDAKDTEQLLQRIRTVYWRFLEAHEDVIRVIIMEALKKESPRANAAFKFTQLFIETEKEFLENRDDRMLTDFDSHLVTEFFTSQIPVVMFFCLRQTWSEVFHTAPETLSEQFINAYDETYGAYQRSRFNREP